LTQIGELFTLEKIHDILFRSLLKVSGDRSSRFTDIYHMQNIISIAIKGYSTLQYDYNYTSIYQEEYYSNLKS